MSQARQATIRLAWLTDLHLNFTWDSDQQRFDEEYPAFVNEVLEAEPNGILLTGDIAEAPELPRYLRQLEEDLPNLPIYFVLGNHDFYRGSIEEGRRQTAAVASQSKSLHYLTIAKTPIALTEDVGLVGHDGWADGRFGYLEWSRAKISDLNYIRELQDLSEEKRREVLNALGDEAADYLRRSLGNAVRQFRRVLLLTHVPPWLPLAVYEGRECDYEYAPYFASKAVGEAIEEVMKQASECHLTVLCGHTHCAAEYQPLPNIEAFAGAAEYGTPRMQRVIELPA